MTGFGDVAGVEDKVVAFTVSVGFGDGEAHAGSDEEEDEFGEFSAALGGEFAAEGMNGRDSPQARRGASGRRTAFGHSGKQKRRKRESLRLNFYSLSSV
jgi:hypothetical protein